MDDGGGEVGGMKVKAGPWDAEIQGTATYSGPRKGRYRTLGRLAVPDFRFCLRKRG